MLLRQSNHGLARCKSRKKAPPHRVVPSSFLGKLFSVMPASKKQKQPKEVQTILEKIKDSEGGILTSPAEKAAIIDLIESMAEQNQDAITTGPELSGTWRLLWGTEKETQFICKNAGLFGTKAGDIYQVIDLEKGQLQNVITFPPSGSFVVNSTITVDNARRASFKFTGAVLNKANGNDKTRIPPFGQGWFETIYLDDKIRMARDIRGDYLVVERDGPAQTF